MGWMFINQDLYAKTLTLERGRAQGVRRSRDRGAGGQGGRGQRQRVSSWLARLQYKLCLRTWLVEEEVGLGGNTAQCKGRAWQVSDPQQCRRGGAFGKGRAPADRISSILETSENVSAIFPKHGGSCRKRSTKRTVLVDIDITRSQLCTTSWKGFTGAWLC